MIKFLNVFFGVVVAIWHTSLSAQAPLEIGVVPHLSTQVLFKQYQPLREYLSEQLGRPVQLLTAPDFRTFFLRTQSGDYDIVITAPHFAGLAEQSGAYQALLVFYPDIQGLLISAKQNGIETVDQLRGQAIIIPNPNSLIARQGQQWLAAQTLRLGQDIRVLPAANQDSTGDMILQGDGAAAMLSNGEFNSIPLHIREQLRIVDVFTSIPGFVLMANTMRHDADFIQRLTQALERFPQLSEDSSQFFSAVNFKGLQPLTDEHRSKLSSYIDITRDLLKLP